MGACGSVKEHQRDGEERKADGFASTTERQSGKREREQNTKNWLSPCCRASVFAFVRERQHKGRDGKGGEFVFITKRRSGMRAREQDMNDRLSPRCVVSAPALTMGRQCE